MLLTPLLRIGSGSTALLYRMASRTRVLVASGAGAHRQPRRATRIDMGADDLASLYLFV
jgi:hypothetical protein